MEFDYNTQELIIRHRLRQPSPGFYFADNVPYRYNKEVIDKICTFKSDSLDAVITQAAMECL